LSDLWFIKNEVANSLDMSPYPMYKQKMIVVATMVLHNFIREHGGEVEDFARFDRDPNFIPTIPERYNKYAVPPSASVNFRSKRANYG
jgi:hypothetical protein